ncbi:RNA polymerase sigma factor [Enterocloster bolteae]
MNIEDLFLENMDQLYRTALFMLSNSLDAEDVVQETYVRLLIKKPFFKNYNGIVI